MKKVDNIHEEIDDLVQAIDKEINFINDNIIILKVFEKLNEFINFIEIEEHLEDYKYIISQLKKLNILGEYNENFLQYIREEKQMFFQFHLNHCNDEVLQQSINAIKNKEINYENIDIELKKIKIGYGGGRPPLNKDESVLFQLIHLENNMASFLTKINDFINNIYILKDFSEINTNVVIIGSNGSGKSTLSRRIKIDNIDQSINIIPSHHILYLTSEDFIIPRYSNEILDINTYQNATKLVTENEPFDNNSFINSLHNLINYLINDHNRHKGDTYDSDEKTTILEKTVDVCSEILKKNIIIKNNVITCYDDNGNIYDFNQMSDGERQVFYFVASVLSKEKDGYIIIDEPENHLNSQVCKSLWDKLEMLKSKSTFVYITHDPKFAISRTNSKIIWSKSFTYPNKWDYEVLESNVIPEELLIEVLGSKENIIFCEGTDTSIDKQIYDSMFLKEKIIPVEGHLNVISYTKAINNIKGLNLNAKGIIDKDGKTKDEIEHYEKNNISVTPFNEVEMLLLCEDILVELKKEFDQYGEIINIDEWKEEIFNICNKNIEKLLTNIIKARIENKLSTQKIQTADTVDKIKEELENILNMINVDDIYKKESEKLKDILDNKKYNELLEVCSLKAQVSKQVPHKFHFYNYENRALGIIKNNDNLRGKLKEKYFKNI